jgi:PQQ-like domain
MTVRTAGRTFWRTRRLSATAALLTAAALLTGCTGDDSRGDEPVPTPTPTTHIRLGDVSVGTPALSQRAGLYMCGHHIVASAPAGGIELDSFVVFDLQTGEGHITDVRLPRGMHPNARWLLTTQCVEADGKPFVSVAYQEMPLAPTGGRGIRAAYTLDGRRLWMRDDINQPGAIVDDVLVLGAAPEQPETAVNLRTGKTVATFDPAVQSRTVVAGNRMVVRALSGPPVLTTLTGDRVATLRPASSYVADGGLLFGVTPAALPDTGGTGGGGLTDASPSPSPTKSALPRRASGLSRGEVQAYSVRTGEPQWHIDLSPDPLGQPVVEPKTEMVVLVDTDGVAHGIHATSGIQEWRAPTQLVSPRVTAAAGMVLFDKVGEPLQLLVDARTGLPLPEPEEPVIDLQSPGALQIVDGVPRVTSPEELRSPPTTTPEPSG